MTNLKKTGRYFEIPLAGETIEEVRFSSYKIHLKFSEENCSLELRSSIQLVENGLRSRYKLDDNKLRLKMLFMLGKEIQAFRFDDDGDLYIQIGKHQEIRVLNDDKDNARWDSDKWVFEQRAYNRPKVIGSVHGGTSGIAGHGFFAKRQVE